MKRGQNKQGFTIVELLIVIVVIAILAAITIVAYNGIQARAKNGNTQSTIAQLKKLVETYNAQTGTYPSTGSLNSVYSDANCPYAADSDGQKTANWIPGIAAVSTAPLPQSDFGAGGRTGASAGCYLYASDGVSYILTAWNAKSGGPSTDGQYRRLGFREQSFASSNQYLCNHNGAIGGLVPSYDANSDYYKFSYTVSNLTASQCSETPPSGA